MRQVDSCTSTICVGVDPNLVHCGRTLAVSGKNNFDQPQMRRNNTTVFWGLMLDVQLAGGKGSLVYVHIREKRWWIVQGYTYQGKKKSQGCRLANTQVHGVTDGCLLPHRYLVNDPIS